jgi:phosphatidate phosphatase APP1
MKPWITAIAKIAAAVEEGVDNVRYGLRPRFGGAEGVRIVTYRSFGTADALHVRGRVLRNPPLPPAAVDDSIWENALATYKRLESDEVPGARLRARFGTVVEETAADQEGFFECVLRPREPVALTEPWHTVTLELVHPEPLPGTPATTAHVLIPSLSASFGIISDVDDTVVQTGATDLLRMARAVFLGNAHTRLPFEGVAAFYEALQAGPLGNGNNPIFYVSSSPWNLYDLLLEFFALHKIPVGPLTLRDWGFSSRELMPTSHGPHKLGAIRKILGMYPHLPFILIGDSGQEDPEIYATVMREMPGRVRAAYIRNVSETGPRADAIRVLAKELAATGGTLLLTDETIVAARHAAEQGWIDERSLPSIGAAVAEDKQAPALDEPGAASGKAASQTPPSSGPPPRA